MNVLELVRKYGNLHSIPEDVLAEHGYQRTRRPDGTVHIGEVKEPLKADDLAVNQSYPFPKERFTFRGLGGKVHTEHLSENQIRVVRDGLSKLEETLLSEDGFEFPPQAKIFHGALGKAYQGVLSEEEISLFDTIFPTAPERSDWMSGDNLLTNVRRKLHNLASIVNLSIEDHAHINTAATEIERFKAYLADEEHIKTTWLNEIQKTGGDDVDSIYRFLGFTLHDATASEHARLHFTPETTIAQAYVTSIKHTFTSVGLQTIAESLPDEFDEFAAALDTVNLKDIPSKQYRKDLQKRIRAAPIAEKKKLSQELKQAGQQEAYQRNVILGAQLAITPYRVAVERAQKIVKKLEDTLIPSTTQSTYTFSVDPLPDKERDKDPGAVSGDCTEGKPLPFAHPQLQNLKVYEDQNHIGNIYLLSAEDGEGKAVWLLDAIQIPKKLDWKETLPGFRDALGTQAQKAGVHAIYVNDSSERISNYDYIGDVLEQELPEAPLTKVDIPKALLAQYEGYSTLQTGQQYRTLWRREE